MQNDPAASEPNATSNRAHEHDREANQIEGHEHLRDSQRDNTYWSSLCTRGRSRHISWGVVAAVVAAVALMTILLMLHVV